MTATAVTPPERLSSTFRQLAERWRADTLYLSSTSAIAMHPAYQRIIGLGSQAIPLILTELAREPAQWFWALSSITGEDPVPPESRGRVAEMAEAWLAWGRAEGWIP